MLKKITAILLVLTALFTYTSALAESDLLSGLQDTFQSINEATSVSKMIRTLFYEPISITGDSMENTIFDSEIMYVNKHKYILGDPERNDIIIYHFDDSTQLRVSRVIAIPFDTIEIINGVVFLNGQAVLEPFVSAAHNTRCGSLEPVTLDEDEYFVISDNRDIAYDSRNPRHGPIKRKCITGRVELAISSSEGPRLVK